MGLEDIISGNIVTDKKYLNSTMGTEGEKPLNEIITSVGNSIMSEGGVRVVKSVQRGSVYDGGTSSSSKTVTISRINRNKSILIINAKSPTGGDPGYGYTCSGYIDSDTSIRLYPIRSVDPTQSDTPHRYDYYWQVIEFY